VGTRKTGHGGMEYAWLPMTKDLKEAMASLRLTTHGGTVFTSRTTGLECTARQHMMPNLCKGGRRKAFWPACYSASGGNHYVVQWRNESAGGSDDAPAQKP